ncbi:MAG TPA: phosphoribosylformylglycinamidine synthase subunit PurS [Longimicrobiales bacterium]|nr:phosphoribosylformylglycinamidine synthase subunit PurS [Longimicrobiales bacterium]
MNSYTAEVRITPRAGLLDPEGKAVQSALRSLEFEDVEDVRVGRLVRVRLQAASESAARDSAEAMCRRLLANPVTEDFEIALLKDA